MKKRITNRFQHYVSKQFFIIGILVAFIFPSQAQNILKGNIHDESGIGIPSTTIRILTNDSVFVNGGITDDNGSFLFKNIKAGEYILAVSNIGYVSQSVNFKMQGEDHTLPLITLKTDNILLNEVEIKASSVIHKKDHLLIIPDKQQIKHAFSGYDLLYNLMIPGLTVNRKDKSVTALTGTATLYINGVKADIREIQNLQPKDIERVEYYTLPATGQFSGDAASVNYITKVYKAGGYITLDGEQNIGYLKGDYNIGAKLSHNNTNYTFFGGHNMKEYDGIKIDKNEELLFPDYTINRNTTNDGAKYKNDQQYAQFKVSNDTKKHNLSAVASFVRDATPRNDRNEILNYTGYDEHVAESFDANDNKSLKSAINLNGIFNVAKNKQWKVRLNGAYTKNSYNRIYTERDQNSLSDVSEDLYSFDAQVAYRYQPDERNSFNGKATHFHNIASSSYGGDYNSWQHLWIGESLFQLDYTHTFGKNLIMMLSPGVSWVNYKLHGNDLRSYFNLRANGWIRYIMSSNRWVGVGFSLGNNQPDISYLNSSSQTVDFYQIKRGNPYLDNTELYQFYSMYEGQFHRLFSLQCKLWYTKDAHNINTNYYLEGDKLISSYASDDSYNTANAEVSITSRISDNLRTNIGFKYNYMYVPGKSGLNQNNFVASFDVNYFIKAFAINAYAKTQEKTLAQGTFAYMKIPASYGLSVRYSANKWMAEVGTENPFSKHLHYREYGDYGVYKYNQVQTSRIYQQTGYIKLAYTFDFGKKTSRESNDTDRNIKSSILKVR